MSKKSVQALERECDRLKREIDRLKDELDRCRRQERSESKPPAAAATNLLGADEKTFTGAVLSEARALLPDDEFSRKVFISHVFRRLVEKGQLASRDLARFKQRLAAAQETGAIRLSRCDLVEAFDPKDVEESETARVNGGRTVSTFHFINLRGT